MDGLRRVGLEPQEEPGWGTDKILSSSWETIWGEAALRGLAVSACYMLLHPPRRAQSRLESQGPFPPAPHSGTAQKPSLLTLSLCPSLGEKV